MRMREHARLRLILTFIAGLAIGTPGCGRSSADGTTAEVNPNLGKNHKEMDDFMKTHKQEAGVNKKTVRNHP
jgi:hypothetical protein